MEERVYRVDRFMVPAPGRVPFLEQVRRTHDVLRRLPGFVQDVVLERAAGASQFSIVTIVIWENQAAVDEARVAVSLEHRKAGFDRHAFMARLGIAADIGSYHESELRISSEAPVRRPGSSAVRGA